MNARTSRISADMMASALRWRRFVFEDENCLFTMDRVDEAGEQRWHAVGSVSPNFGTSLVLLVVHVYREDHDGEEIIRIISARRAGPNDVRRYKEQKMD